MSGKLSNCMFVFLQQFNNAALIPINSKLAVSDAFHLYSHAHLIGSVKYIPSHYPTPSYIYIYIWYVQKSDLLEQQFIGTWKNSI